MFNQILVFAGSLVIGGVIGYLSEKFNFTHNGAIPSIIICLGGVILFYMIRLMFGLSFGSPGVNAIVGAAGALIIVPTAARK